MRILWSTNYLHKSLAPSCYQSLTTLLRFPTSHVTEKESRPTVEPFGTCLPAWGPAFASSRASVHGSWAGRDQRRGRSSHVARPGILQYIGPNGAYIGVAAKCSIGGDIANSRASQLRRNRWKSDTRTLLGGLLSVSCCSGWDVVRTTGVFLNLGRAFRT